MSKFSKGKKKSQPAISTASLPDIVFMLLFFFIVTTIFKEKDTLVGVKAPIATEITKLDRRTDQIYYWIGKPSNKNYGTGYRVQVDDALAPDMGAIRAYLIERRGGDLSEVWDKVINNFKIDEKVNMRIVKNVQEELRNEDALKVAYTLKDKE
jgi:hypothetical protein|tara:strand:+ start:94 stop:552 length:459 start_codon:yes stop_codon:yes gene_type:complete